MDAIRQRQTVSHRRLGVWLLLSALAHGLLTFSGTAPTDMVLQIPAPELAVALRADPRTIRAPEPDTPVLARPTTTKITATEPLPVATYEPSRSETIANHLHSLLRESLNRHFIYPPVARRHGWEGRVELLVRLDENGRLYGVRVIRSSGYPLLDEDALLTLQRIGSIPAARAWLPEQGYATRLPVVYKLTEG